MGYVKLETPLAKMGTLPFIIDAINAGVSHFFLPGVGSPQTTLRFAKGKVTAVRLGDTLYLQQNPDTASKWAERAKKGAKIVWIIDESRPKDDQYRGYVEDGVVFMSAEALQEAKERTA